MIKRNGCGVQGVVFLLLSWQGNKDTNSVTMWWFSFNFFGPFSDLVESFAKGWRFPPWTIAVAAVSSKLEFSSSARSVWFVFNLKIQFVLWEIIFQPTLPTCSRVSELYIVFSLQIGALPGCIGGGLMIAYGAGKTYFYLETMTLPFKISSAVFCCTYQLIQN